MIIITLRNVTVANVCREIKIAKHHAVKCSKLWGDYTDNACTSILAAVQPNLVSPAVGVQPEVVMSLDAVGELAQSTAEVIVRDATVVREVIQVNAATSPLALRHVVRQHAVYTRIHVYISQGSVATLLRCGGILNEHFIASFHRVCR